MKAASQTLNEIVAQRASAMAVLRGEEELLHKAQKTGTQAALAAFDAPVLEHLRKSNHAGYEAMLNAMQRDIEKVLQRP